MRSAIYTFGVLALLGSHAQAAEPITNGAKVGLSRMVGTVQSVAASAITVLKEDGGTTEYQISADSQLLHGSKASRAELISAKYVNCTAAGDPKGTLQASRCEVIPPDAKAINVGQRPGPPGTIVTVGKVASVSGDVSGTSGALEVVVTYNDSQQRIAVPASAQIVKPAPLKLSQMKAGDKVIAAVHEVDGKPTIFSLVDISLVD